MQVLGYEPCLSGPNLWTKAEVRPDNKYESYFYILCYVDDIMFIHYDSLSMVIHHDSLVILKKIDKDFTLKPSSSGETDIYLGV